MLRDSLTCPLTIASGMAISPTQRSRSTPALMVRAIVRTVEPVMVIEVVMSLSVRSSTPLSWFILMNPLGISCLRQSVLRVDSHRNMKVCATTASPSESLLSDFFFCGPRFSFSTTVARSCLTSRHRALPRPTDSPSFHSGTDSMLLIVHTENCSSGSLARTVPNSSVCGGENLMVHPPSPVLTAAGSALKVSVEV